MSQTKAQLVVGLSPNASAPDDALNIDSSGRVGIGEASPNRQLVVNGGTSEGVVQITNDTSGTAVANGFELIHFTNGETQLLNRENGAMRFDTNGSERMRILAAGGLTFNGDTAATNALDDYEEGTWVPQYTTTNSDWSASVDDQSGLYVKIGKMVHVTFRIQENRSAGTGALVITNFPFDLSAANRYVLALNPAFGGWGSTNAPRGGFGHTTTQVLLKKSGGSDGRSVLDTNVDAAGVSNPGLIGSMTYYIS